MKKLLLYSVLCTGLSLINVNAQTLVQGGSYASDDHTELAPDSSCVGGNSQLASGRSYAGE